jgi:hypothetical protein
METSMKRPNFFILGAPKCGTTSMAAWLSEHPNVFMSPIKEPFFFCTDLLPAHPRRFAAYERLFSAATREHSIVAEATTSYLYSNAAVPKILGYADDPRLLVMIRNPIDMAYSLHGEMLYQGDEHIADFEQAWMLQDDRRAGRSVNRLCRDPQLLLYGPYCRVGEQLERLYTLVPREHVCVLVMDDVRSRPHNEYLKLLGFLGLPDDDRSTFPAHNPAKARRSRALVRLMRPIEEIRRTVGPVYRGLGILRWISDLNRVEKPRIPMSGELRASLVAYFRDDVHLSSELLDRDLTHWLTNENKGKADV